MISRPENDLSIIIAEKNQIPKTFLVPKKQVRLLFAGLGALIFLSLGSSLCFLVYFKSLKNKVNRESPLIISQLNKKSKSLEQSLLQLEEKNKVLLTRLQSSSSIRADQWPLVTLFHPTPGAQDFREKKMILLESIEVRFNDLKVEISFHMVNNTKNDKNLSGHAVIFFKNEGFFGIFPPQASDQGRSLFSYFKGESFSFSRFRPTKASFNLPAGTGGEGLFEIFLFSRYGDLILQKEINPKKI